MALAVPAVAIEGLRFLTPGRAPRAPLPCRFPVAADPVATDAARPEVAKEKEKADSAARRLSLKRRLAPHAAHAHALSAAGPRRPPTEHAAIHREDTKCLLLRLFPLPLPRQCRGLPVYTQYVCS